MTSPGLQQSPEPAPPQPAACSAQMADQPAGPGTLTAAALSCAPHFGACWWLRHVQSATQTSHEWLQISFLFWIWQRNVGVFLRIQGPTSNSWSRESRSAVGLSSKPRVSWIQPLTKPSSFSTSSLSLSSWCTWVLLARTRNTRLHNKEW